MQRIFWSIAIVSGVLLSILVFISFFGQETDVDKKAGYSNRSRRGLEPKNVLLAFTLFGWVSVLLSYLTPNLQTILIAGSVAGIIGALLPWLLSPLFASDEFDPEAARKSTGEVLASIPPHRNGFGKVYLNLRAAPYEMDAVTAGEELPAGVPVRVVDVIDDGVLLVEGIKDAEDGNYNSSISGEQGGPLLKGPSPGGRF